MLGIEPRFAGRKSADVTIGLHGYLYVQTWGSNSRPPACRAGALPTELIRLNGNTKDSNLDQGLIKQCPMLPEAIPFDVSENQVIFFHKKRQTWGSNPRTGLFKGPCSTS